MHAHLTAEAGQCAPIKIIRREQETLLAADFGERLRYSRGNSMVRDGRVALRRRGKANASFDLLVNPRAT
jgi:hypothetical protein